MLGLPWLQRRSTALAFFVSLVLAYSVTPIAARLAGRWSFIDTPSGHSTHTEATPVLGGLALGMGFLVIGLAIGGADGQLLTVLACACVLAIVGLVDDRAEPFATHPIGLRRSRRDRAVVGRACAQGCSGWPGSTFRSRSYGSSPS